MKEALEHPWVLGKAARFSHMDTTQRKLQEFNARRKLKVSEGLDDSIKSALLFSNNKKCTINLKDLGLDSIRITEVQCYRVEGSLEVRALG